MNKKHQLVFGGVLLVALLMAIGVLVLRQSKRQNAFATTDKGRGGLIVGATNQAASVHVATGVRGGTNATAFTRKSGGDSSKSGPLTPDQKIAEKMNERLDNQDEKAALEFARQIIKSGDADVRSEVVTVLGWIGVRALPELSQMLGDKDETVARTALEQWHNAVGEVQDEDMRGKMLAAGMLALTDQEALESTVMDFNELPDAITVRYLIGVIESSNPVASEVAREHYNITTGNTYTDRPTAEQWIKENAVE